jgi:alanine racemase
MRHNAELIVDLDVYRANLSRLREFAPDAAHLAVVKANAYGHGMIECARAARDVVDWVGVATPAEALELRAAGDSGPLLCWLATPGAPWAELIAADIEVTASSAGQLAEIVASAPAAFAGRPRVQLKVDTGLSRNGAFGEQWTELVAAAAAAQGAGHVEITGMWSHFACADEPANPANDHQERVFRAAIDELETAGVSPQWRHLCNSAGAATRPSAHFDLVRWGIASYGLDPDPAVPIDRITPILTARAPLAATKRVPAGTHASYGWHWEAGHETTLGLVPVGYGEGIHRSASNRAHVGFGGRRVPVRGTICMDQLIVDLGDTDARPGDLVTIFGPGADGEPTVANWAEAAGTITYEIVTRLAGRWNRTFRGAS